MGDKVDELFEILGNKKTIIIMIVAYVILMLIILAIIWWPKEKTYATYEKVDIKEKKETMAQSYINTLSDMLKKSKKDEFKNLISSRYTKYTGKTREEIIEQLNNAGYFSNNVELKGMNIYVDGDTYVYSTTVYSGNNKRNINIIERCPYEYEIVFDDFYSYEEKNMVQSNKNIKFTIEKVYRNLRYIEFDMKIENLNDTYARFDFSSTVGVQAVLKDGNKYSLSNSITGETYTNIDSNTVLSRKFVFEIPAQLQEGIEYIVFNGVTLEFSNTNIQIIV